MNTFKRRVTTDSRRRTMKSIGTGGKWERKSKKIRVKEGAVQHVRAREVKDQETIEMERGQMRMRSNELK